MISIHPSGTQAKLEELRTRPDLRIDALGSGSDYTPFIQHLGIASLSLGYSGEDGGGIYHSIYDDFYWYTHFSDTDFVYGRALSQTIGTAVVRLADSDIPPYDFTALSDTLHRYVDELKVLLKDMQDRTREQNREIREGVFTATGDPRKTYVPPSFEPVPPFLNFAPLDNALVKIASSAHRYQRALEHATAAGHPAIALDSLRAVNQKLIESERKLTRPEGLPGRPWYRHEIYAPGLYTGYGVKTLPAVREAMELKHWEEADKQIGVVAQVIEDEASLINSASSSLERAGM